MSEELAAEVHRVYCAQYEKNFGKPYRTGGDYSKLDESTKDYDRAFVRWHQEKIAALSAERDSFAEDCRQRDERIARLVDGATTLRAERDALAAKLKASRSYDEIVSALKWAGIGGLMRSNIMIRLAAHDAGTKENK